MGGGDYGVGNQSSVPMSFSASTWKGSMNLSTSRLNPGTARLVFRKRSQRAASRFATFVAAVLAGSAEGQFMQDTHGLGGRMDRYENVVVIRAGHHVTGHASTGQGRGKCGRQSHGIER